MSERRGWASHAKSQHLKGPSSLWDTRLTLIHPFHGEEKRFEKQWENWDSWPSDVKEAIDVVIIDDYGTPAITDLITPSKQKRLDFNLSVYRILDDLKWSTPCALNLGLMVSCTPWTLIMDSDCLFQASEIVKVLDLKPMSSLCYKFDRKRVTENEHQAKNTRYLPCTMLQHKDAFLAVNGFDEDFCGTWSGGWAYFDNHFDGKQWDEGINQVYIKGIVATEYMEDIVGNNVQRSKAEEKINKKLMYKKNEGEVPNSQKMLRFSWERALHHRNNQ